MILIHLCFIIMFMTIGTAENGKIARIGVAFGTLCPFSFMCTAIDAEILTVMVKGGWCPGGLAMATLTSGREIGRFVIGIPGGIIISRMTAKTGFWRCTGIVTVVTNSTVICNIGMSTG